MNIRKWPASITRKRECRKNIDVIVDKKKKKEKKEKWRYSSERVTEKRITPYVTTSARSHLRA